MSFLAPLYIAGTLAVALPIIFHLIRRTPQGRQEFSSLMFLASSPPTITRRSRITNWVLLLLRAAALCLLALAFARPFLRSRADQSITQPQGRRVAILVDTSASMRRGDLWAQAKRQVDKVLGELGRNDEVGLYFFDRAVRPAATFNESRETADPARRTATIRGRLEEAEPSWSATRLGEALATVADLLAETDSGSKAGSGAAAASVGRQVVLVSDVQQGAHAEALQGHEWPQNVLLEVRPVALKQSSNASVQLVRDARGSIDEGDGAAGSAAKGEAATRPAATGAGDARLRVRVTNQPDSTKEQFSLAWADAKGTIPDLPPTKVYVPPGRGQTVRVAWPTGTNRQPDRLVLQGDDDDFDNTLFLVPLRTQTLRLVFVGDDAPADTKGLLYYLRSAAADTATQKTEFVTRTAEPPPTDVDLLDARLVVVAAPVAEAQAGKLRRWAESSGGTVLWVLKDTAGAEAVASILGGAEVTEAPKSNFALLGRVDFEHPLFAPFADARFGDFTKIHFWRHRRVKLPAGSSARGIASFDDGDPFLIEQTVGKGRLLVATSGWHPADSQLALSTKFVPLISGLLRGPDAGDGAASFAVNDPIPIPTVPAQASAGATVAVIAPGGAKKDLPAQGNAFDSATRPGIYRFVRGGTETPVAVNVAADESRTAPMPVEDLEHWGAKLGSKPPSDELATRHRQLQIIELENRQKLWRWLIVCVLGLLVAETALAGLLSRRSQRQQFDEAGGTPAPQAQPQQVVTT